MNGVPDVEQIIYNGCKNYVGSGVNFYISIEALPRRFPLVLLYESSNTPYLAGVDSSRREKYAVLEYTAEVFTNDAAGKKKRCRTIMARVCEYFCGEEGLGFTRTFCKPVLNTAEPNIYRMTARFEAVLDRRGTLYRK